MPSSSSSSAPPASASTPPISVSPAETARLLNISVSRAYELMRNGELQSYKEGRCRKVTMTSIFAHVARRLADSEATGWEPWEYNPRAHESADPQGTEAAPASQHIADDQGDNRRAARPAASKARRRA